MNIIWWIFLPSLYLLIAALVKIFAAKAKADEQMTSEGLATLHFGETGFVTDDGEGNVSWEPVSIPLGPRRAYFAGDVVNAKAPTEEYGDDCQ